MSLVYTTRSRRDAACILAGLSGYDAVDYRGIRVSRATAVAEVGTNGDISVRAAERYLTERLERHKEEQER